MSSRVLIVAGLVAVNACSFAHVRSAVVSPGPSLTVQGAMSTDVGKEVGWFFGDECDPCTGPLPSLEGSIQYGRVPSRPDGKPFAIGVGVSLAMPYVEGYVQLSRSPSRPFGIGGRFGTIGELSQGQLYARLDKPLSPGRRLVWNPGLFYHEERGQNHGRIFAVANGFGLELSKRWVAATPSLTVVVANAHHTNSTLPPRATPETRVFGVAALGLAFRRDPYR